MSDAQLPFMCVHVCVLVVIELGVYSTYGVFVRGNTFEAFIHLKPKYKRCVSVARTQLQQSLDVQLRNRQTHNKRVSLPLSLVL